MSVVTYRRPHTAPTGLSLSGTSVTIFSKDSVPLFSFHSYTPSAELLKAQLEAQARVKAYRAAERQRAEEEARTSRNGSRRPSLTMPPPTTWRPAPCKIKKSKGKSGRSGYSGSGGDDRLECGLTRAQIRALQDRELTPEDYEILLRLDESVAKKDVLSAEQAEALIEHTMEEDESCCVCMCDLESGESAVMLACGHYFHPPCIKDWLVKGKDTCPMCNAKAEQHVCGEGGCSRC